MPVAKKMTERQRIGIGTLERYTGSAASDIKPYILLTNFERYIDGFGQLSKTQIYEGSAMQSCNCAERNVSIINYGVGSPTAALIVELLSFIRPKAVIMLGMCGGLRDYMTVGDFFLPVAAIRGEGTSDHYMPRQVPSLPHFNVQRFVSRELENRKVKFHTGVIHSTNYRFWEFDEEFKTQLLAERVQTIDMECATLFTAGYARGVAVGALMLISDKPLHRGGVKTKESAKKVFAKYKQLHIEYGINVLQTMCISKWPQIKPQW